VCPYKGVCVTTVVMLVLVVLRNLVGKYHEPGIEDDLKRVGQDHDESSSERTYREQNVARSDNPEVHWLDLAQAD
jgi:hypothetical protein